MNTTTITDDEVLSSESFRLLNLMINELAEELHYIDQEFLLGIKTPRHTKIRTRIYEETRAGAPSGDEFLDLEIFASLSNRRKLIIHYIEFLQKTKLRLMNDCDFTNGSDAFQKAVFRP